MKIISFAKTKLGLLLLSSTVSVVVFVGVFETLENIQYYRWRTSFDNYAMDRSARLRCVRQTPC